MLKSKRKLFGKQDLETTVDVMEKERQDYVEQRRGFYSLELRSNLGNHKTIVTQSILLRTKNLVTTDSEKFLRT